MTRAQTTALVRQILTLAGGYFIGAGYLDAAQAEAIIGGLVALAGIGWSVYAHRRVGVIKTAAALPEVEKMKVTRPSTAAKVSNRKVTIGE